MATGNKFGTAINKHKIETQWVVVGLQNVKNKTEL